MPQAEAGGVILSSLCYLRRDGHTLMLRKRRGPQRGIWNGLGGKFEAGETPEACARREVLEESGLVVGQLQLRGLLTFPRFDDVHDWYVFVFTSNDFRGDLAASPEGDLAWVPDGQLLELELLPGDRVFLPWLEQPQFFSACLDYHGGVFAGHQVTFYPPLA